MTFFVDSNFFLQCKKYNQLDWSEITNDKDITIIITRPVQIEIDKLKNDGNSRRSRRSRETTSLFRKILAENNFSFLEKTPSNDITLKFAKQYSDEELSQSNKSFDLSNNDDKILAILNNYLLEKLVSNDACAFLTNDTNPVLTAKLNDLPIIQIPDTWTLEPENDEKDKEIFKLRQQVLEYQKKEPIIEIEFGVSEYIMATELANEFNVQIKIYNKINQTDIEELVDSLKKKHPKQTNFDTNENGFYRSINRMIYPMHTYYPPSDEEINNYNTAYQKWEEETYELFSNYADKRYKYAKIFPFHITLKNNGNISAEDLLLDFEILTGGQLIFPDFDDEVLTKRWTYPTPPKPPQGKWRNSIFSSIDRLAAFQALPHELAIPPITLRDMIISKNRDKNAFYWKDGKLEGNTSSWRFECEEFRHKLDNENFYYYLVFDDNSDKIVFQVVVSASNMSSPIKTKYILHKKYTVVETKDDIRYLLEHGVTEEVMEKIEGKNGKNKV